MGSYIILGLIALCIGYFLGRHTGWKEGMEEGIAYAPIELKAKALQQGVCPLCQTAFCEENDTNPFQLPSQQEIPSRVTNYSSNKLY